MFNVKAIGSADHAPLELGLFDSKDKIVKLRQALKKKDGDNNEYAYRIFFGEEEREIEEDNCTFAEVFGDDCDETEVFGDDCDETEITVYYTTPTAAVLDITSDVDISILEGKNITNLEADKEDTVDLSCVSWRQLVFGNGFPVKLRIITEHSEEHQRLHAYEFILKECDTVKISGNEANGFRSLQTFLDDVSIEEKDIRKGILMEFTASPRSKVFNKSPGIVLPIKPFVRPTSDGAAWHDKKIVQNALNCCSAANKDFSGEKLYNFLKDEDSCFLKRPESILLGDHKSVLALSEDMVLGKTVKTMFVAFRGTDRKKEEDIFTDIDIEMSGIEEIENEKRKVHNGFLQRANQCFPTLEEKVNEYNPNRIIVCGHSLGGAVSALVYILLSERLRDTYELHNITFASPLFGNLALREYLKNTNAEMNLFKNMYHFVVAEDIIPALLYVSKTYSKTSFPVQTFWKILINRKITDPEKAKKFVEEIKQKKKRHDPFFLFEEQDGYVAMGNYLFLQDEKIHILPNDPQWIGQALVGSLNIIGQLGFIAAITNKMGSKPASIKEIEENHKLSLHKSQIMKNLFK